MKFWMTDEKYSSGFVLEEYNGMFSLISARQGNDDKVYKDWGKKKLKDGYTSKDIPLGPRLGGQENAEAFLREAADAIKAWGGEEEPPPIEYDQDGNIPF